MASAGEVKVVQSPPCDHRVYKALQLPNGLRAILVHDPQIGAQSSSAPSHFKHAEVVDNGEILSGSDSGSDGDDSGSGEEESSGSDEDMSKADEDEGGEEEHEHVRPHHPRALQTSDTSSVKKAAAALSVGVGHYSDPSHMPGLSHYLEHMLFMGSEKYPDENDYDAFLSAHSGASNACTEEESTTYHFDCAADALEPALDRFAQFFVAPLVKADALEREVLAVDNEFAGVLQNDACRQLQLRSHTARAGHPAANFGWGNRKSLEEMPKAAGINVRDELLKHYKAQYSAERCNLVVMGGESLQVLEAWVNEKFAKVPGGRGPRPRYSQHGAPFSPGQGAREIFLLPSVRDEHRVNVVFQLPCLEAEYRKKAEDYVSHLVGHEGKGSLLAALKSRGWATDLCAGVIDQTSAAWLFDVSVTLTAAGLAAGRGCGLAAVEVIFQYLAMLRAAGPQKWAWDEMAAIAEMKWRFLEEEDAAEYAAQMASDMHTYPLEHVLAGGYLHEEFDPVLIAGLLDKMTPENARVEVQSRDFEGCKAQLKAIMEASPSCKASGMTDVTSGEEPWFGFPYAQAPLPKEIASEWETSSGPEDLALPPPNPYLPSDFTLRCEAAAAAANGGSAAAAGLAHGNVDEASFSSAFPTPPVKLSRTPGLSIWHKMDSDFKVPRAHAYFRLSLPAAYSSPSHAALTHLVVKLLDDALCQEAYLADVADLRYSVWFEGAQGIDIKVDGFSHKLLLLSTLVFRTLAALRFADDDFLRVHEGLLRTYRNANMKPLKHANYLRLLALKGQVFAIEVMRLEVENATAADVRAFLPTLLSEVHLECLVFGNVDAEEAKAMGEAAKAALGACLAAATPGDCCLSLPQPCSLLLRAAALNAEEDNSALEAYFQCSPAADPKARALLDLVDQLVYEPCYDTLRTKEQLGYTVSSGPRSTHGVSALCVLVQSGVHGPSYLDERVDAFLAGFVERLRGMEAEEFEKNRAAVLANKLMKDRNLAEEGDRGWDLLVNRGADFGAKQAEVAALREVTQAEVAAFFEAEIAPGGAERRKLAVHVAGKAHNADVEAAVGEGVVEVKDVAELKSKLSFYPAPPLAK